jgi:hypothetical protein
MAVNFTPTANSNISFNPSTPTSPQSPSLSQQIWGGIAGFSTGAVKGAIRTLQPIGNAIAAPVASAIDSVSLPKGATPQPVGFTPAQLQTHGAAENLGETAADIGIGTAALATGNPETLLGAAGLTGAVSAAQSGLDSLGDGSDLKTAAKNAFVSGLTGAAVGSAGKYVTGILSKAVSNAPDALYNNSLKVLNKLKVADKSPASFLKNNAVWGNLGAFAKAAQEGIGAENTIIKQAAYNTEGGVAYDDIKDAAVKQLTRTFGDLYTPQQIDQLVDDVPLARLKNAKDVVPWVDADGVRSSLGSLIGDSKWLSTTPSDKTQAAQAVYGALSDAIKSATGTTDAFGRLSQWISTNKVVTRAINLADSKYGLGLYDAIGGTGGAIFGGLTGNGDIGSRLKNAAAGGLGGIALERGVNSPAVKTGLAQLITRLGTLPVDTAGKITKAAVLNIVQRFTNAQPDQQEDQ